MELKKYIQHTTKLIIPTVDHIQLVEYKMKNLTLFMECKNVTQVLEECLNR